MPDITLRITPIFVKIPEDNDSELKEVKTTLKDFEKLDYDEIVHNLVRRAAEDDMDDVPACCVIVDARDPLSNIFNNDR